MLRFLLILFVLIAHGMAQDPRITEFLAVNTAVNKDEDGTFQGWIEIWNPSPTTVTTLTGYKLGINANTPWTFPAIQIMPDERILIWASGKNKTVVTAPLHTDFTLPAAGATLVLRRSDNAIISQFTNYPAQTANTSYGRDESDALIGPTQVGFYSTPTPGERNNYSGTGVAGKVAFSKPSQAISSAFVLTLSQVTPDPNGTIRYTLDRTMPTVSSPAYTSGIPVSATAVVRARVFSTGKLPGETETNGYLLLESSSSGFSSPMPILVVSNFGFGTPPTAGDQASFVWLWEPAAPDNRARFTNLPTLASRIVIDLHGSSTSGNAKFNVNMECRKARDDDDRNVSFLGMASGSDYILSGPFDFDRAEIRNPFAYALSRSIGRWAPDTRQVEVFFDVNAGPVTITASASASNNDYFGIYNLTEKIRRDKNRVNVLKLDNYNNDSIGKTGGFIWKIDRRDAGDNGFAAGGYTGLGTGSLGPSYYYPKENEIFAPQRDPQEQYLTSYVNSYYAALQGANYKDPVLGYAAWIDVPEALDHHLVNVWTMNVDALRLSGYWHKERGGKLIPGPVWDFDRTMESADGRDDNPVSWRATSGDLGTDFFNYPWWDRMFTDIDFYQKYIDRWVEIRLGPFSTTKINALLDQLNATVPNEACLRDVARWAKAKRGGTFPSSPTPSYAATQDGEILRMKDWMLVRANFMESQWVTPVTLSAPAGPISAPATVTMSAAAGSTIYYTLNGADPRPSGGGVPSSGGVLTYSAGTAPVINSTTRIKARAYNASWNALTGANNPPLVSKWSGVTDVRYSTDVQAAPGNIAITELNYHPTDPTPAELAVNPAFDSSSFEFIEIKNLAATPVDLAGLQFTAGITFTFSGDSGITIGPGQFAIVAANPTAFITRYGSKPNLVGPYTGELADSGEQIVLKSATNVTIADFTYSDSWYGSTDGDGKSLAIYNPTASIAAYSTKANWRASAAINGSAGADEPNLAPTPNAGPDVTGTLPSIAITGSVSDDTFPSNTVSVLWSALSGPGSVGFAPNNAVSTTATFSLPGVYGLRLSANDSVLSGTDDVVVTMRDTPGAWLLRHPGIGTLNDDFDGDGRTNFYEWALVLDPSVPTAADGSTVQVQNNHLVLYYQRQKNSPFVTYKVQVTNDLTSWADPLPGEVTENIISDDGIIESVRATDNTPMSSQPHRFIRLKVLPLP